MRITLAGASLKPHRPRDPSDFDNAGAVPGRTSSESCSIPLYSGR